MNRKFNCSGVDMLMASNTIHESFTRQLSELSQVRTNWTEAYTTELGERIKNAMDSYLGIDPKKEQRQASKAVQAIMAPARRDLSFLKTQIDVDFNGDTATKIQVHNDLGFNKYLNKAKKGDQEAMIQQLHAFKKGMTPDLRANIIARGTHESLIDRILSYTGELVKAEVSQENTKESSKQLSREALNTFNDIYDEIIGICKIASSYYQYDPLLKAQFTFSKVLANMNTSPARAAIEEEAVKA